MPQFSAVDEKARSRPETRPSLVAAAIITTQLQISARFYAAFRRDARPPPIELLLRSLAALNILIA